MTIQFPFPITPSDVGTGKLVSFISLKAGSGASTLACCAAMTFAQQQMTALVDLNPESKVRCYMGMPSDVTTASVLNLAGIGENESIMSAGENSRCNNLVVFPGTVQTLDSKQITAVLHQKACVSLKQTFTMSVAVLGGLTTSSWAAILLSDIICVVMTPSRADMDAYRDQMEIISRLGAGERTITILNKLAYPGAVDDDGSIDYFRPDIVVPYDVKLIEGCNKRDITPSNAIKSAMNSLFSDHQAGDLVQPKGLLKRFLKRDAEAQLSS